MSVSEPVRASCIDRVGRGTRHKLQRCIPMSSVRPSFRGGTKGAVLLTNILLHGGEVPGCVACRRFRQAAVMAGYGVSLHGLGRVCGGQAESPTEKDVDPANFQQLRQLRDQSVMQGDVAALRQEMLTLKMVVSTAKTEMTVLIEQEVGEAIAKERAERERAERLMDERVAACVQQSQIQQEEVEKLQGQESHANPRDLKHGSTARRSERCRERFLSVGEAGWSRTRTWCKRPSES